MAKVAKPYQQPGLPLEPLTMNEIIERYYGQTVIMQITSKEGRSYTGYVLAVGPNEEVMKLWVDFPLTDTPGQPHYCFVAVPMIETFEEWKQALDRGAFEGPESEWDFL